MSVAENKCIELDLMEKYGLSFIKAQLVSVSMKVIISIIFLNLIGNKHFDHFCLIKFSSQLFCLNLYYRSHFHNFWSMEFSTCKTIVSLGKAQALIFLEYWLYEEFIS